MSALLLAAVGGARRKTGIALAADHLVAVELGSQGLEGRLNDTTTEAKNQVEGRLLLDVVVRKGAAILELLTGEDQALLVWGNACWRKTDRKKKRPIERVSFIFLCQGDFRGTTPIAPFLGDREDRRSLVSTSSAARQVVVVDSPRLPASPQTLVLLLLLLLYVVEVPIQLFEL